MSVLLTFYGKKTQATPTPPGTSAAHKDMKNLHALQTFSPKTAENRVDTELGSVKKGLENWRLSANEYFCRLKIL
jgi:hypothetical protein